MKLIIMAAIFAAFGCSVACADNHAVKIAKNGALGSYLIDAKGMTLYYFKKDTVGKSACAGDCVVKWPLYFREKVAALDGLKGADFGEIKRDDGKMQSTYKEMPLYYFVKDTKPGDTTGQGANNVWYIVTP